MHWCITRNMSWEAVGANCRKYNISFEELPVAGENFWNELVAVLDKNRRTINAEVKKIPHIQYVHDEIP